MNRRILAIGAGLIMSQLSMESHAAVAINLLSQTALEDGAEIVSYTPDGNTVAATVFRTTQNGNQTVIEAAGVAIYTLNADGTLAPRITLSQNDAFNGEILGVSSVALDPLGRGFGAMTIIPEDNGTTEGIVAIFNYRAGSEAVIQTFEVGFHPDNVIFSRDGTRIFVANEGEFTSGGATDAPGSVSIIDLGANATLASIPGLTQAAVTTIDFSVANLASGVGIDGLRYNDNSSGAFDNRFRHVEPEYITEGDGRLYVTLQENNAIAELSLTGTNANKFTAIRFLGGIEQTIDASDRDSATEPGEPAARIDDLVVCAFMPDTVASFVVGGVRYLVTANEGDFRPDDEDRIRVKDFSGVEPGVTIDRTDAVLGRLRVLKDLSDPDQDGLLDVPVAPGTRSFTIWNALTGEMVADTGSFEPLLLTLDPTFHNIDGESGLDTFDDRSDDKGPEPEAVAAATINGRQYVFVGLERQNGLLMYNVENPAAPAFTAYVNNGPQGLIAPESILFVPATSNPTGNSILLVGYEEGGGDVAVYSVTGVPSQASPAPVLSVKKSFTLKGDKGKVRLKGKASEGTVRVEVNGKRAKGTTNWNFNLKVPKNKKRLVVRVVAFNADGSVDTERVVIKRRK